MRAPPTPLLHRLRLELILKGRRMMLSDFKRMNVQFCDDLESAPEVELKEN